jgi:hypothetical protein
VLLGADEKVGSGMTPTPKRRLLYLLAARRELQWQHQPFGKQQPFGSQRLVGGEKNHTPSGPRPCLI